MAPKKNLSVLDKMKQTVIGDLESFVAKQMKAISKAKSLTFLEDECHYYITNRTFKMIDKAIEKENS